MRPRGRTSKRVIGLRAATLLTSVALVAFLVAGLWLFLHNLVSTRMHALEIESTRESGETARNLVAVAEENQLESARDWGIWNATWDFMRALDEGRDDEAYRAENLNPVSLINAGAPVIIYLDNDGKIVEALVVENEQSVAAPEDVRSADWARLAESVDVDGACGLVRIGDRVLVVGVSAITQAMGQGERAGTLVMGRWLDDEQANELSHAMGKPVSFRAANASDVGDGVVALNDAHIVGEFLLRDIHDAPVLMGQVTCARDVHAQAHKVERAVLVGLLLFGAVTAGAVYTLMHVMVVSRLIRASREVLHVTGCDAGSALIRVDRHDELGALVASVNQLTTKINTSREKIEEALHEQTIVSDANRKLAMVAARTDNAVIITDAKGVIEWVNLAFMRLTGYSPDQAIGRRPGELLQGPLTDLNAVASVREALRQGKHIDTELLNYRQDGSTYWVRMSIEPVCDDDGVTQHYIAIESDVSQQKAFEKALIEARAAAEDAASARAVFVANVSHEIRTPLNAILGFTELLRRAPASTTPESSEGVRSDRDEWLGIVHSSATHLLDLINDVLDLSKLQAGRMTVEQLPTRVHELITHSANMHSVRAQQKNVALEVNIEETMPARLDLDPTRMRQLLANVVGNAIKFTDVGAVRVDAEWMQASDDPRAGLLLLTVQDSGMGIPDSKMRELFTPFVQGDTSVTRRFGGTGLGLAICKGIAEAMGGTIEIESEVGKGTTVRIEVPAPRSVGEEDASPTIGVDEVDSTKSMPRCLAGARLLIADDMPANLRLFEIVLREAGASVVTVNDGQQAVAAALRQPFELILLDGQMPVMDGLTAASIMRSRGIAVPILALTAHAMESEISKFIEAGCDAHLSKPISPIKLVRAVAEHLGREGTQSGPADEDDLANDPEVRAIIDEFVESVPMRLAQVLDALSEGDWESAARHAHALKGTAGTLGVHAVARAAAAIERAAEHGDVDAAVEAMQVYDMLHNDEVRDEGLDEGREAA